MDCRVSLQKASAEPVGNVARIKERAERATKSIYPPFSSVEWISLGKKIGGERHARRRRDPVRRQVMCGVSPPLQSRELRSSRHDAPPTPGGGFEVWGFCQVRLPLAVSAAARAACLPVWTVGRRSLIGIPTVPHWDCLPVVVEPRREQAQFWRLLLNKSEVAARMRRRKCTAGSFPPSIWSGDNPLVF